MHEPRAARDHGRDDRAGRPLAVPDRGAVGEEALAVPAVRLFADRAASAAAGFTVDEHTVAAVIDVCRRVDGLPLAIELAAARLRSMTLPQLAARLDDRFRLLTGGSRTAMARQRTLRAVVDWSWDLLDEAERALLRRLAVFAGGATLEAARPCAPAAPWTGRGVRPSVRARRQVAAGDRRRGTAPLPDAGDDPRIRARASRRRRASLRPRAGARAALRWDGDRRGATPARRGAAEWLAACTPSTTTCWPRFGTWARSGEARLVARTVVSLLWFWLLTGSRQEALAWLEFARSVPGEVDPLDRLLIDGVHALARAIPGEAGRGSLADLARRSSSWGADLSEHPLLAAARPMLALAIGRERVLELLEQSARHPDPWVRATVPFVRVQMAENEGDLEGMRGALDEALRAFRRSATAGVGHDAVRAL